MKINFKKIIGFLKKFEKGFENHKDSLNALLTLTLIIVTGVLIYYTIVSTQTLESIQRLEVKGELREKISLTNNLLIELNNSQDLLEIISSNSTWQRENPSQGLDSRFRTVQLEQALAMKEWGTISLRQSSENLLLFLNLENSNLNEITNSARAGDNKVRVERIEAVVSMGKILLENNESKPYGEYLNETEEYLISQEKLLREIDNKVLEDLD